MSKPINKVNLKAPGNWINDPNGFIYYKGKYHLFYQYFPYEPVWGTMHWGHAISDDLVNWEHLGVALLPTKAYDRNGAFSGSAIEIDGKMHLYYTAVVYEKENPENVHISVGENGEQSQALLVSADGFSFDNFSQKQQVIPVIYDTDILDPHDCRDPKVFKENDTYYMCLASTHRKEKGVFALFKSMDGLKWELSARLESEKLGFMLECPDLFKIGEQWLLACCPMGVSEEGITYPHNAGIIPMEVDLDSGSIKINGDMQYIDYGFDLYAPQSNLDKAGRRVMIAWARMQCPMSSTSNTASLGKSWNGMMAIPRVIEIKNGHIYTTPHPNIRKFFGSEECITVCDGKTTLSCSEYNSRLVTKITEGQWINISGYRIGLVDGCVVGDRSSLVPDSINIHKITKTPYVGMSCELEIYMDADLIETFVNGGEYVLSHVTYKNTI